MKQARTASGLEALELFLLLFQIIFSELTNLTGFFSLIVYRMKVLKSRIAMIQVMLCSKACLARFHSSPCHIPGCDYAHHMVTSCLSIKKSSKRCRTSAAASFCPDTYPARYIHVCMYIYMYACMFVYVHIYLFLYSYKCVFFLQMFVFINISIYYLTHI